MQIDKFIQAYALKSDEELLSLAQDIADLTLEARTALQGELVRRRLDNAPTVTVQQRATEQQLNSSQASSSHASVGEFVAMVTKVYKSNFWLFIKLIAPAVVLGYFAIFGGRTEAREIARHLPRGAEFLQHRVEIVQIWVLNLGSGFVSWMAFCVSYAGICSAVTRLRTGMLPTVSECFVELRNRTGSFLAVSLLLYLFLLLGLGLSVVVLIGIISAATVHLALIVINLWYVVLGLAVWVLSRFSLSIPAVLLGDCSVGQSIFRSDELTEGKWLILAALLTKSIIGGYVAGMLPFWLARWIGAYVQLPIGFLRALSIAAVISVEPFMFIGFSLLYAAGSAQAFAEADNRLAHELT